jgi:eukaryotic-like serine/threonine-protein kinase
LNESEFSYQAQSSVGPYTLIAQIGEGGMGTVWRARRDDGLMEREVAVKLIAIGMRTMAMRERFARERQILASLNHPNIAGLYDAGVTGGGQPYLVLELIDGERIDAFCDRNALPVAGRLRLFLQVLAAVSHAHQHLVVHRDLKPANILITPAGEAKLLDFGVSKLLDGEEGSAATSDLTRDAGRLLTPEYAAPEQLKNRPVTTATDVYALGVLLYQLLTGCLPHAEVGDTPVSLAQAIIEADPPRASTVATRAATVAAKSPIPAAQNEQKTQQISPEMQLFSPTIRAEKRSTTTRKLSSALSGDLDNILAKALRKDPYERYATVTEFADDIRAHLELRPVKAQPDSMTYRTQKFVRRNRGMVATAGFTMFAILAGVAATAWQANEARKQTLIAQREASKANAIRDYMVSMFRAVGRDAKEFPKRGNTTARELLDNAAQKVGGEFNEQPEVRAFMRETLSGLYYDLDQTPKALSEAQQWFDEAQRTLPPTHPQLIGAMLQQATVLGRMNRAKESKEMMGRAQTALEPLPHGEQWMKLHILKAYIYSSEYEAAKATSAIDEAKQYSAQFPQLAAELDYAQGQVAFQTGKYKFGEEKMGAAIAHLKATAGDDSVRTAEAQWRLGIIQLYRNNWPEAERVFSAALPPLIAQSGAGHRDTINLKRDLAFSKARLGKRDEAFTLIDEVLLHARERKRLDNNSAFLSGALQSWGRVHFFAGDTEGAHQAFQEALALVQESKSGPLFEAISTSDLVLTTALKGDTQSANEMAQKVVGAYTQRYGAASVNTVGAKVAFAEVLAKTQPAHAQAWVDAARATDWSELAFPSMATRSHLVASELAARENQREAVMSALAQARALTAAHPSNPEASFRAAQTDVLAVGLLGKGDVDNAGACGRIGNAVNVIATFNVSNSALLAQAKRAQETCTTG